MALFRLLDSLDFGHNQFVKHLIIYKIIICIVLQFVHLDLFSYVTNPPYDLAEKVDFLLNLVFQNPKSLRYRDVNLAKPSDLDF